MASNRTRRTEYLTACLVVALLCGCKSHYPLPTESNVAIVKGQLTAAINAEPQNGRLYIHRAKCLLIQRQYAEALADADKGIALGRNDADAHQSRGRALAGLKRREEALVAFETAQKRSPTDSFLYEQRAVLLQQQNKHADAINECSRGIGFTPGGLDPSLLTVRATSYEAQGRPSEARRDCDEALSLSPNMPAALLVRARCRLQLNDYHGAQADAERVVNSGRMHQQRDSNLVLGDVYAHRKQSDRAIGHYKKVIQLANQYLTSDNRPEDFSEQRAKWQAFRSQAISQVEAILKSEGRKEEAAKFKRDNSIEGP